ncbi:unnamed protein product [Paramecium sonneborni]|uniref:non-specific serine/threonine protein kinase n=1 Tax=Paramecium sonneborni TaxID=65129 RepID=A0A8S1R7U2_9CILI|nr:unnamed protein product [Paramecium sonneborni]
MSTIQVSHYSINKNEMLGKGAYGIVYSCKSENNLKNKDLCAKVIDYTTQITQVQKEVQLLKLLQKVDNPNLVQIHDIIIEKNQLYIIMDRCRGGDLKNLIQNYFLQKKYFSIVEIMDMIRQILLGYKSLIQNSIIHRDLKPANILVEFDANQRIILKLTDFGMGRILDDISIKQFQTRVGTPIYMAPQIVNGEPFSSKCDIFSLGIILHELAFLEIPQEGLNKLERYSFQKSLKIKPFVCPDLLQNSPSQQKQFIQKLINQMLSLKEERRPSWEELLKSEIMTFNIAPKIELKQISEQDNLLLSIHKGQEQCFNEKKFLELQGLIQKMDQKDELQQKVLLIIHMIINKAYLVYNLEQLFQEILKKQFSNFDNYQFQLIQTCLIGYRFKILQNAFAICFNDKCIKINSVFQTIFKDQLENVAQLFYYSNNQIIKQVKKFVLNFFVETKNIFTRAEDDLIKLKNKFNYPKNIDNFYKLIASENKADIEIYGRWFHFFWSQHIRKLFIYDKTKIQELKYLQLLVQIDRFLNLDKEYPFQNYDKVDINKMIQIETNKEKLEKQIYLRVFV